MVIEPARGGLCRLGKETEDCYVNPSPASQSLGSWENRLTSLRLGVLPWQMGALITLPPRVVGKKGQVGNKHPAQTYPPLHYHIPHFIFLIVFRTACFLKAETECLVRQWYFQHLEQ